MGNLDTNWREIIMTKYSVCLPVDIALLLKAWYLTGMLVFFLLSLIKGNEKYESYDQTEDFWHCYGLQSVWLKLSFRATSKIAFLKQP